MRDTRSNSSSGLSGGVKSIGIVDAILLVVLALAALKTNLRLEQLVDIDGTDETQYLAIGLRLPTQGLPDAGREIFFAPLYSAWYLALSQIQEDPLDLLSFNFRVLGVLLPWALYGLWRRLGCGAVPAALSAFYFMTHSLSLEPVTRSAHFAMLCLGLGIWLALRAGSRVRQGCALGLGAVAAAFTRPEYAMLAVATLAAAVFFQLLPRFRAKQSEWKFPVAALAMTLVLVLWFGPPVGAGNNRSFLAFKQHFSAGYVNRGGSDLNPWWDFDRIVGEVFPQSESLFQALRQNPAEFRTHVVSNVKGIFSRIVPLTLSHRNFLLPDGTRWQQLESGLAGAILLGLLIVARRRVISNGRWWWQQQRITVLFIGGTVLLAIAGMVLTSTADRYFLPLVFFGWFLFVGLVARTETEDPSTAWVARPIWLTSFALILIGLAPAGSYRDQGITSTRATIAELRRHAFADGTGFLEAVGMKRMEIFLPTELRFIHPAEKNSTLRNLIATHHLGVVHVTPYLKSLENFATDPEWMEFISAPQNFGFTVIALPFQEALYVSDAGQLQHGPSAR